MFSCPWVLLFLGWLLRVQLDSYSSGGQEKTTFTYPFGTIAYRRMPFGLYNAPAMFHFCMLRLFSDMVEQFLEMFMDDFSIYRDSFDQSFTISNLTSNVVSNLSSNVVPRKIWHLIERTATLWYDMELSWDMESQEKILKWTKLRSISLLSFQCPNA